MIASAIRRLLTTIPVMGVVALFVFSLLCLMPGDPAALISGDQAGPEDIARIRATLGLDRPFPVQFGDWCWRVLHGDLGTSIFTHLPVAHLIGQRLEPTLSLLLLTLVIAVVVAVPLGMVVDSGRLFPADVAPRERRRPVGLSALTGPRDVAKAKADIAAAGYKGEPVVVLVPTDFPTLNAMALVGADMLKRCGLAVDVVATDWGSVAQRRASRKAPAEGGWSVFFTNFTGLDENTPATHLGLRGNGAAGWFGWATAPKLEELRDAWFAAPDAAAQKAIGDRIQAQAFSDVPDLPLGKYLEPTVYAGSLKGVLTGNVAPTAPICPMDVPSWRTVAAPSIAPAAKLGSTTESSRDVRHRRLSRPARATNRGSSWSNRSMRGRC